MSEKELDVVEKLAKAYESLSDRKKEYLLGYADGVADMAAVADEDSKEECG